MTEQAKRPVFEGEGKYDSHWDAFDDGFCWAMDEIERLKAENAELVRVLKHAERKLSGVYFASDPEKLQVIREMRDVIAEHEADK